MYVKENVALPIQDQVTHCPISPPHDASNFAVLPCIHLMEKSRTSEHGGTYNHLLLLSGCSLRLERPIAKPEQSHGEKVIDYVKATTQNNLGFKKN